MLINKKSIIFAYIKSEHINIFINQKHFDMKRGKLSLVAVVLSGSLLFSSCVIWFVQPFVFMEPVYWQQIC